MKKLMFLASAALFVVACGQVKEVVITQADADRVSATYPGTTTETLLEGQKLYNTHCMKCHQFVPSKFSEKTWRKYMPEMGKLAKIDAKTEESILRYVATFSKK
jgi:cytochrome c5